MEFGEAISFYVTSKVNESYSLNKTMTSYLNDNFQQECSSFVESESGYQSEGNTFYID